MSLYSCFNKLPCLKLHLNPGGNTESIIGIAVMALKRGVEEVVRLDIPVSTVPLDVEGLCRLHVNDNVGVKPLRRQILHLAETASFIPDRSLQARL